MLERLRVWRFGMSETWIIAFLSMVIAALSGGWLATIM